MAEPEPASAPAAQTRRFLTFRSGSGLYALPAEQVSEIIHVPPTARLPHGPASLIGLANLRGVVLPLASLRALLGQPEAPLTPASRAVVLDAAAPVALAVDAVDGLVAIDADRLEDRQVEAAIEDGEKLTGAFSAGGGRVAKVLDIRTLLDAAFTPRERPERAVGVSSAGGVGEAEAEDERQKLVTFQVADQEYALALEAVREIIDTPSDVAIVPRSESAVLGVAAYRDTLLPLLSLRALLGLPLAAADDRDKVVVARVGGALVGLVADRMRSLISADPKLVEPTPPMLAARTGGEAKVKAIYRGAGGSRLVSILTPDQLFREDVMQRLSGGAALDYHDDTEAGEAQLQFLVFRLGGDEFGLPIETVDEVARVPAQMTRVPKTPKFLEGVINLRGEVVPVVDQRRRFDMPPAENAEARRLIVLRTDRHRAGVIVDGVSEVLRCPAAAIEEAPDLTGEATRLVHGVVNLEAEGRLVLLLDPSELLTRAEHSLLDAFKPDAGQVDA